MEMFPKHDLSPAELRFFGLTADPFNEIFDEEPFHCEELDAIRYQCTQAILNNQILIVVGESGSGKSTMVQLAEEDARRIAGEKLSIVRMHVINPTRITDVVLEEAILQELRGKCPVNTNARSRALRDVLVERRNTSKTALVLEDAHRLRPQTFMHLRTLREFDTRFRLVSVILVGEPDLGLLIKRSEVKSAFGRARIRMMPPISALTEKRGGQKVVIKPDRTGEFLQHLYNRIGHSAEFTQAWSDPAALELVGEIGQYPLNISNVACLALKTAHRVGSKVVTPEAVRMVGSR